MRRRSKWLDIYIDTDSQEIYDFYSSPDWPNVTPYMRLREHIEIELSGDISPAPLMIKRFIEKYARNEELIITSHVTSPFLGDDTLSAALRLAQDQFSIKYSCQDSEY